MKLGSIADIENLDLGFLDELHGLITKVAAVDERLQKMAARKADVAAEVYERVHQDYSAQRNELQAKLAPLQARAAEITDSVGSTAEKIDDERQKLNSKIEELEFRFSLGEFDDAEHAQRRKPLQDQLQQVTVAVEKMSMLRQRLASEGSGKAVSRAIPAQSAAPAAGPPPPVASPPSAVAATMQAVLPPEVRMPPPVAREVPPSTPQPPPLPADVEVRKPARRDATFVFKPGKLLPQSAEAGSAPLSLGLKPIMVGSAPGCDVCIADCPPQHVEFRMARTGFLARDASEGLGFKVNGLLIQGEVLLADGDTIDIGPARFAFKQI